MKKRLLTVLLAVCLVLALGTVSALAVDTVASFGGTEYSTLQEAIDAAESAGGGTITLLRDATGGAVTFDKSGEYVLDLDGHTYTSSSNYDVIMVKSPNVDLTIENGKLYGHGTETYGIYVYALDTNGDKVADVMCDNVTVTLDGVELDVTDQGLGVQGLNTNNNLIVKNSTVSAGTAIYFPPITGTLIIEDSNIIGQNNGVYVKGGEVYVSGDSYISASAVGEIPDPPYNGSGELKATGIAVFVEGNYTSGSGARPISVNIYGGTIKSENSYSVYGYNIGDDSVQDIKITGGQFEDNVDESTIAGYLPKGAALKVENGEVVTDDNKEMVATVNGVGYDTLANAIAAADDGDTVTLLANVPEDVVIPADADFTLDLNGFTLTNVSDHTITNNGTLTIVGNGTVDNITHAHAAIMNNGTMTINGGTFTRSQETQDYVDDGADNSWYTVVNKGTMTINDGTFTTADGQSANLGNRSSLIRNGDATDNSNVTLAINGGTFTSGANVLKNEAGAVISSITGGVFTMDNSVISWSGGNNVVQNAGTITSITGGTFRAIGSGMSADEDSSYYRHGIWNSGSIANMGGDVSFVMEGDQNQLICLGTGGTELNITGGSYNVVEGELESNSLFYVSASNPNTPVISGGSFSDPVSPEYLDNSLTAELYSCSNSDTPYSYYSTVEDAMDAAQPGDIVTDLSKVTSDTRYNVTFNYGNNDSETVSVSAGATITFTAPTRSGYEFRGWRDNSGELHKAGETVTVNSDMTFTAIWSAINIPDTYDIEIADAANGSVDTSLSNASAGSTITITATPDSGYSVASVTVTGSDGRVDVVRVNATTYTFKMPAGDVTVRVTFTDSDALPFTDVSAGQWFYDAVAYVYTNGMMEGDSATTFNPDGTMTRAMFWTVLGRIDGATITGANWADQARDWAMAEGVSDGTDPNGLVTREQMVTMLWRYAGEPESTASLSAYTDADSVSDWAETAMRWAIDEGIITGMTDTTLVPQGTATRAQCAAIFMRFDQM